MTDQRSRRSARPLKVLHISAGNLFGGVETVLVNFARCRSLCPELVPEFAVCYPGRLEQELRDTGAAVHVLGPARVSRPWSVMRARAALRNVLSRGRHDAGACHMSWAQVLFGKTIRAAGVTNVGYLHGPYTGTWLERLSGVGRPDLLIAPSDYTLRSARRTFPNVPGEVVHNPLPRDLLDAAPVTADDRARIRAGQGVGPDDVVVLTACRLEPWKGVDLLIEAMTRLSDLAGWKLWVAGGVQKAGELGYLEQLKNRTAQAGIADRVRFLGQRNDVHSLMGAADIYSQGNRGPEGFSMSFVEACHHGLPIVTTALGGTPELLNDETGSVVAPEDVDALASALRRLIVDANRRRCAGEAARARAVALCHPRDRLQQLHAAILQAAVVRHTRQNAQAIPATVSPSESMPS